MIIKTYLISILLVLCWAVGFSQNRTYLGAETNPKVDLYRYIDGESGLHSTPAFMAVQTGFTVGQELNETFLLETGFYINDHGYAEIGDNHELASAHAMRSYQVPIRLKTGLNLLKNRLKFITSLGYSLNINGSYGAIGTGSAGAIGNNLESLRTTTSDYGLRQFFHMFETGVAVEMEFNNSITLLAGINQARGFQNVVKTDVVYEYNNNPPQNGTTFHQGDYVALVFGIKYPISEIWNSAQKSEEVPN